MLTNLIVTVASFSLLLFGTSRMANANVSDAQEVRQVIFDVADAVMAFPRTKDHQSVLRFFAADFSFIDDVDRGSNQSLERFLTDIERESRAESLAITERVADVEVHVQGSVAWATYEDVVTIARTYGKSEEGALCTAVFKKEDAGWVYTHEHCSSYSKEPTTDIQDSSRLTAASLAQNRWRIYRVVGAR